MSSDLDLSKQLTDILNELDAEKIAAMSDSEVLELRKKLNPYGRTIEGSNKYLTYSYTDLQFEYTKKLITTTMIGFLNRMCDEWRVPDGIPIVPVYDYVKNPALLDEFEKTLQEPEELRSQIDENKRNMEKRVIIKEFLEDMFQYNPDMHVRSAYKPNPSDDERKILDTPAAQLAIHTLMKNSEFKTKWDRCAAVADSTSSGSTTDLTTSSTASSEDVKYINSHIKEMIPPVDLFHRFQYYYDSNYEELKSVTNDLYCDKPCFETAINPYAWHDTEEDAEKFITKHRDEVITTIYKAHSGKWNIFSPYKKVRESMKYFNKNTEVLEEIAKQIESDSKIGAELMRKRIKIKKQKNIAESGPDDAAFIKWKEQNSTLKQMGAETFKPEEYDCPSDALEVPVFRISNGGTKLERSVFHTQVVNPDVKPGQ